MLLDSELSQLCFMLSYYCLENDTGPNIYPTQITHRARKPVPILEKKHPKKNKNKKLTACLFCCGENIDGKQHYCYTKMFFFARKNRRDLIGMTTRSLLNRKNIE